MSTIKTDLRSISNATNKEKHKPCREFIKTYIEEHWLEEITELAEQGYTSAHLTIVDYDQVLVDLSDQDFYNFVLGELQDHYKHVGLISCDRKVKCKLFFFFPKYIGWKCYMIW